MMSRTVSPRSWASARWLMFAWLSCSVLSCTVLSCSLVGCDDEQEVSVPSTTDLPTQGPPTGPHTEDPDFDLEAQSPRLCPADGPLAPPEGFVRLSVPASVTAKGARDLVVSGFDFSLEDSDGHVVRPTLASCGVPFERAQLAPGETHRGELAFDVAEDARKLVLHFQPFIIGRQEVDARVLVPGPAPGELRAAPK